MANEARAQRMDRTKNLVGFTVGDLRCAVDILRVREVLNPLPIVALPQAPVAVAGVADHRGEVLPVVDLRRRLGLPPADATRRTKWVVVRVGKKSIALVVDSVSDVFGAGEESARDVPALGPGDAARGFAAAYAHDGALVFVIDVDRIAATSAIGELPLPNGASG